MERYAVIGLGRFGARLAQLLSEAGAEVIAVDRRRELVEGVRDLVTLAVCLDATDEQALKAQSIDKVDVAVVGIGAAFEESVLTTVLLRQLGVERVISRATSSIRGRILQQVGAHEIANPERESAERWTHKLLAPQIMERLELGDGYSLVQVAAPENFVGKTLADLDVRRKYRVTVVALRRTVEETAPGGAKRSRHYVISVPMAESVIKEGDVLFLIGADEAIQEFPSG